MRVEPLEATLGAYVSDVKLADLSDEDWAAVHAAFLEYGVLVFQAQYLTGEEQLAFGLRFGEREGGLNPPPADKPLPTRPGLINGVAELSNVSPSGEVL